MCVCISVKVKMNKQKVWTRKSEMNDALHPALGVPVHHLVTRQKGKKQISFISHITSPTPSVYVFLLQAFPFLPIRMCAHPRTCAVTHLANLSYAPCGKIRKKELRPLFASSPPPSRQCYTLWRQRRRHGTTAATALQNNSNKTYKQKEE